MTEIMSTPNGRIFDALITRPAPDGDVFADECRAKGVAAINAPLMEVRTIPASMNLDEISALAFTSANGVRAFAARSGRRDFVVYAVGDATARASKERGFAFVHTAEGDSISLSRLIAADKDRPKGAVMHIAGSHRAGDLVLALRDLGVSSRREVLYEAHAVKELPVPARDALSQSPPIKWVAFFSPRTVALFLQRVEEASLTKCLSQIKAACLSAAVAEQAANGKWRAIEVSARRDACAMIEMMARDA